jgi:hypothetical protein
LSLVDRKPAATRHSGQTLSETETARRTHATGELNGKTRATKGKKSARLSRGPKMHAFGPASNVYAT